MPRHLSLAVVGAQHPNKRGPTRRFGISVCKPGDPIDLVPEPKNEADPNAIAVYAGDIQIGYLTAERAPFIGALMSREIVTAIFQSAQQYGAVIRVGVGCIPVLPDIDDSRAMPWPPPEQSEQDFWPDPEWPDE